MLKNIGSPSVAAGPEKKSLAGASEDAEGDAELSTSNHGLDLLAGPTGA